MKKRWHYIAIEEIRRQLRTDLRAGLSKEQVLLKKNIYGKNVLPKAPRDGFVRLLLSQLKSPLVFILFFAAFATLFLGEYIDTSIILATIVVNTIVGVFQEERAGKAFDKLKHSRGHSAIVIRGGLRSVIDVEDIIPGDIIMLEAGMYVPADARLVSNTGLEINESALTGEWVGVEKEVGQVDESARITEQTNMVWMGTFVISGFGVAVVVSTGEETELGRIADELSNKHKIVTPIQKSIKALARYLAYFILCAVIAIFAIGAIQGEPISDILLISIAVAVAAMPEGLPAAVTVVMALGMEAILNKSGLVRNLIAAETLGSTTTILTDKTGTLTKAEMRISSIITYNSLGRTRLNVKKTLFEESDTDEKDVLAMAILTSDAFIESSGRGSSGQVVRGRPVERAIVLAGLEEGLRQDTLLQHNNRLDAIPFESERRFSATLHALNNSGDKKRLYLTGAPEVLLSYAKHIYKDGGKKKVTQKLRKELSKFQKEHSDQGYRILAIAYRDVAWERIPYKALDEESELLSDVVFGGFIIIQDPIRSDVAESIKEARNAGVRVIMVTGDNKNTARRVAIEVGITPVSGEFLTGEDIDEMSDEELKNALKKISVFARILPHQKTRIVKVHKQDGEVVAMIGDGINDAPALHRADIGISLNSGTEVAKEASDLILMDNSFTVIVHAIEEGRRILDNLKKIVAYLLPTSFSEIFVVGGALLAGAPIPILPAQILWINMIEESFMNFSFAFEPSESDVMRRNPRSAFMQNIITPQLRSLILIISLVTGVFLIALYFFLLSLNIQLDEVRTVMFAVLSADSIFLSFSLKDLSVPIWRINFFSNKYLIAALVISILALLAALFVPALRTLLSLVPISGFDLIFVLMFGVFNLVVIEIVKYIYFRKTNTGL